MRSVVDIYISNIILSERNGNEGNSVHNFTVSGHSKISINVSETVVVSGVKRKTKSKKNNKASREDSKRKEWLDNSI